MMKKIRLAIVEDEAWEAELLAEYISRSQKECSIEAEVQIYGSATDFLEDYHFQYDIVFLDIEMDGINGMEAAVKLREKDSRITLMFVTNMAQYAVKGYEVDAVDFVVKPVSYDAFLFKFHRVLQHVNKRRGKRIVVHSRGDIYGIQSDDLIYVEVSGHNLVYHTRQKDLMVRGALNEAEEQLEEMPFSRCNHCYLVNLEYVEGVEGYMLLLPGGERLQISRSRKTDFLKRYARFMSTGN